MNDLFLDVADAVKLTREADNIAEAADEGHDLPSTAADYERRAADALFAVARQISNQAERYRFAEAHHRAQADREPTGVA